MSLFVTILCVTYCSFFSFIQPKAMVKVHLSSAVFVVMLMHIIAHVDDLGHVNIHFDLLKSIVMCVCVCVYDYMCVCICV